MRIIAIVVVLAAGAGTFLRPDNSVWLTKEGQKAFAAGKGADALKHFDEALKRADSPIARFNAGTASIQAGEIDRGIRSLRQFPVSSELAPDARYNEGNAHLGRAAVDDAIRSYKETLRIDPSHASAKRNLEIAMRRRDQQPQSGKGKGKDDGDQDGGGSNRQPDKPSEESRPEGSQPQPRGETDAERLLRAVEQQEREELSRMRKARARERAIGW